MNYKEFVRGLDNKPNAERRAAVTGYLQAHGIKYAEHSYGTGTNIIADLGAGEKRIGISSHFDRDSDTAGANDNASAVAVCLSLAAQYRKAQNDRVSLRIFFFDEEENGLKGSSAYVKKYGVSDLACLINLEMAGRGDRFAIWPSNSATTGTLINALQRTAGKKHIESLRFDRVVAHTADHAPFLYCGLEAFSLTSISGGDVTTAAKYLEALALGADELTLHEIFTAAPLFEHYHKPTDTYDTLSNKTMAMMQDIIWETVLGLL